MKKSLLISSFLPLLLMANEGSFFNDSVNSASKYWDLTKQISQKAWNDSNDTRDMLIQNANIAWEQTKKYSNTAKNIAMEQTLLNGLNLLIKTPSIEVLDVKIDEQKSDKISLNIRLDGEDQNLSIQINSFDWDVVDNKKYIILNNIDANINIAWIDHILNFYLNANNGYLRLPYSITSESLLFTIKSKVKSNYKDDSTIVSKNWEDKKVAIAQSWKKSDKKDITNVIDKIYDNDFIQTKKFIIDDKKLHIVLKIKDSSENFILDIDHFDWGYSKDKKLIIIKNIYLDSCSKPWVSSFLTKPDSELHFRYTKIMSDILLSIEPKSYLKR